MDHNEAIQLQAAVKYVLGELSPVQRDDYEEHYFDCAECAIDIKALAKLWQRSLRRPGFCRCSR